MRKPTLRCPAAGILRGVGLPFPVSNLRRMERTDLGLPEISLKYAHVE
jgi:hypothetical protein